MSDKQIVWEAPPDRGWRGILGTLTTRRGEWARVGTKPSPGAAGGLSNQLKKIAKEMGGRWEIVARTNGDGSHVFARFLGPEEAK